VAHLLSDADRRAVEMVERAADGSASEDELAALRTELARGYEQWAGEYSYVPPPPALFAHGAVLSAMSPVGAEAATGASAEAVRAAGGGELLAQAALVHCLFGNPFRPLPSRTFPPHVLGLAHSCYEAFPAVRDDYKVLADALSDLGEDVAAAHCREATHAKGCFVLDWIVGRP
jgi:hypothetical protein